MKNKSTEFHSRYAIRILAIASMALIVFLLQSDRLIAQTNCASLESGLKGLEAAQARLQQSLQKAAGEEKQSLVQQIREMEAEIRQAQAKLNRCKGIMMDWTVAGRRREALVFPPASNAAVEKHPLIFAWHGHGGTIQGAAQDMGFQTLWPEAIVVYPQGLKTETQGDPDGNGYGWQKELGDDGNRDLKFFDAMLTEIRQKYAVDEERIYTTGFSNGTGFSYLLWAERGDKLAAIGAVSGVLSKSEQDKPIKPRALISIAGANGIAPDAVNATVKRASEINEAGPREPCDIPGGAPADTKCHLYSSLKHTPVKQITHPDGHHYFSWEPEEIVKFFKNHKKP
jgi:polyhydroxybutyrate depolymerase